MAVLRWLPTGVRWMSRSRTARRARYLQFKHFLPKEHMAVLRWLPTWPVNAVVHNVKKVKVAHSRLPSVGFRS